MKTQEALLRILSKLVNQETVDDATEIFKNIKMFLEDKDKHIAYYNSSDGSGSVIINRTVSQADVTAKIVTVHFLLEDVSYSIEANNATMKSLISDIDKGDYIGAANFIITSDRVVCRAISR